MASFVYSIRSSQKNPEVDVKVRIRFSAYFDKEKVTAYAVSGIVIPKKAWDVKKSTIKAIYTTAEFNEQKSIYDRMKSDFEAIKNGVFQRYNMLQGQRFDSAWLQAAVDEYWEQQRRALEAKKQQEVTEANRETLNEYIDRYLTEIAEGNRLTNRNTKYALGSVKAIRASLNQFKIFQQTRRVELDFDDMTLAFYKQYTGWLVEKKYTTNSIGKCIKDLKNILENARDEGLHQNEEYKSKRFSVTTEEADNIYLTRAELDAINQVDLSNRPIGYIHARDVFMAGCWLAQRVSDYNHLLPENVVTERIKIIDNQNRVVETEKVYIVLTQQKTKVRVKIPANGPMRALLIKYNNQLPYIWEQKLNQYIKVIAKEAGIMQMEQITSTKGGVRKTENIERYKLIHSHTARRTGATLMYLSGMDIYDICKITGHASVKNLRKYIKADELDVAEKITGYDYFN